MDLLADANGARVYCAPYQELAALAANIAECDALITDTPYSARTHAGHDSGTKQANRKSRARRGGKGDRRAISYAWWDHAAVCEFVDVWAPRCRGWFVTITDHVLAPWWERALAAHDRYVFSPIAFLSPGSRVRIQGDGPTQWSCWIIVSRPRTRSWAKWGALPGGYVLPAGQGGDLPVVGGKPLWLMQRLVEDYSRPGDLVVDPCCGAGTTAVAAILGGRRAIAGDVLPEHAQLAAQWITNPTLPAPGADPEPDPRQASLFDAAEGA